MVNFDRRSSSREEQPVRAVWRVRVLPADKKKEFFDIVEAMVFPSHTADSEGAEIIAA